MNTLRPINPYLFPDRNTQNVNSGKSNELSGSSESSNLRAAGSANLEIQAEKPTEAKSTDGLKQISLLMSRMESDVRAGELSEDKFDEISHLLVGMLNRADDKATNSIKNSGEFKNLNLEQDIEKDWQMTMDEIKGKIFGDEPMERDKAFELLKSGPFLKTITGQPSVPLSYKADGTV